MKYGELSKRADYLFKKAMKMGPGHPKFPFVEAKYWAVRKIQYEMERAAKDIAYRMIRPGEHTAEEPSVT